MSSLLKSSAMGLDAMGMALIGSHAQVAWLSISLLPETQSHTWGMGMV